MEDPRHVAAMENPALTDLVSLPHRFNTIAHQFHSKSAYFSRFIEIKRNEYRSTLVQGIRPSHAEGVPMPMSQIRRLSSTVSQDQLVVFHCDLNRELELSLYSPA